MKPITIPYHLFIAGLISLILFILILALWKKIFSRSKKKTIWVSILFFLIIYTIIVGSAALEDIYCQWDLNKYDLNMDGFFSGNEICTNQQAAYERLINDLGRNLTVFTGLIFSGVISLSVFIIGSGIEKYRKLKKGEKNHC